MSKGLEKIELLKSLANDGRVAYELTKYNEWLKIIENELKRLEEIDDILNTGGAIWATNGFVGKELKALKITKEKDVDIFALKFSINLKQYNCKEDGRCPLTQEEYDLLREVML